MNRKVLFTGSLLLLLQLGSGKQTAFCGELSIPNAMFKSMIEEYSEEGDSLGFDNWISNEPNFWSVLNSLRKMNGHGSVFIGVGPDQNFAYIEALKPEIAFIVDIRRQNLIQHLVYKALFTISETPLEYFSTFLSKDTAAAPSRSMDIGEIVQFLKAQPSGENAFLNNLERIAGTLENKYGFTLPEHDYTSVAYMLANFCMYGASINLFGSPLFSTIWITYDQYLTLRNISGEYVSLFNDEEKYRHLRKMQFENRIIPLIGNFTGEKTFQAIAEFMQRNNLKLSAFYVSNVEEKILLDNDWKIYSRFVNNVRLLPVGEDAVIIRTTNMSTPFSVSQNHLQKVTDFLENYDNGVYKQYTDIIDIDRNYFK